MCVVSMVTDHYRTNVWPTTVHVSYEQYLEYLRLKRAAEEIDRVTNQPDCIKPELKEWEEQLKKMVEKIIKEQK